DDISQGYLLAAALCAVELRLHALEYLQRLRQLARVAHFPILLRCETNARTVGPAALVGAAERCGRRPRRVDQLRNGQSRRDDLLLEGGDVLFVNQRMINLRDRILPELRLRNPRSEIPGKRAHVPVQQLVPRLGERVLELLRMFEETLRDRRVARIGPQREVR